MTPALALYSLKKIANYTKLPIQDARLLKPVEPGILSWVCQFSFWGLECVYSIYVWRGLGLRGFIGPAILPLAGLIVAQKYATEVVDNLREKTAEGKRLKLA